MCVRIFFAPDLIGPGPRIGVAVKDRSTGRYRRIGQLLIVTVIDKAGLRCRGRDDSGVCGGVYPIGQLSRIYGYDIDRNIFAIDRAGHPRVKLIRSGGRDLKRDFISMSCFPLLCGSYRVEVYCCTAVNGKRFVGDIEINGSISGNKDRIAVDIDLIIYSCFVRDAAFDLQSRDRGCMHLHRQIRQAQSQNQKDR